MAPRGPRPLSSLTADAPLSASDKIALSDAGLRKVAFPVVNGAVLTGVWLAFQEDIAC